MSCSTVALQAGSVMFNTMIHTSKYANKHPIWNPETQSKLTSLGGCRQMQPRCNSDYGSRGHQQSKLQTSLSMSSKQAAKNTWRPVTTNSHGGSLPCWMCRPSCLQQLAVHCCLHSGAFSNWQEGCEGPATYHRNGLSRPSLSNCVMTAIHRHHDPCLTRPNVACLSEEHKSGQSHLRMITI